MTESRPPLPPFTRETAMKKVHAAADAWNTRDPQRVAGAYTPDSVWRGPRPAPEHGVKFPLR
jgi:nuclear transport factor 2 (NTF2) superfamily protein